MLESNFTSIHKTTLLHHIASFTFHKLQVFTFLSLSVVSGSDYDDHFIALPFSDLLRRQCVNISIFQDGIVEPVETFSVNLVNVDPAVTLNVSTAGIAITDSDSEIVAILLHRKSLVLFFIPETDALQIAKSSCRYAYLANSLFHPGVTISLGQSVYAVTESFGFVEVCVDLQGQLARDVEVELRTEGDTASEFIFWSTYCILIFNWTLFPHISMRAISLWTGLWKCIAHTFILWSNQ